MATGIIRCAGPLRRKDCLSVLVSPGRYPNDESGNRHKPSFFTRGHPRENLVLGTRLGSVNVDLSIKVVHLVLQDPCRPSCSVPLDGLYSGVRCQGTSSRIQQCLGELDDLSVLIKA